MGEDICSKTSNETESALDEYELGNQRGLLVIFTYKYASNCKEVCTKDSKNLEEGFKSLNYEIIHENFVLRRDIVSYLEKLSKSNFTEYHSLIVAALCNSGKDANLAAADGEKIRTEDLLNPFSSVKCPNLIGKPKIFIFQSYNPMYDHTIEKTYPSEHDFIFFYGNIEGKIANRLESMPEGSWLIKYLVDNVKQLSKKEDLLTILTRTFSDINKKSEEQHTKYVHKQVPCLISTLIKKFYLVQKEDHEDTSEPEMNNTEDHLSVDDCDNISLEDNQLLRNGGGRISMDQNEGSLINTEVDNSERNNLEPKIIESREEASVDSVAEEVVVIRYSLTALLLPTMLFFILLCAGLYMFIYEEEYIHDVFGRIPILYETWTKEYRRDETRGS